MQPTLRTPAKSTPKAIAWLTVLGGVFVACFFLFFTWRGLVGYYTGDDMMNLYGYWSQPVSALLKANIFFWLPSYRPFGGLIYRPLFAIFGFNPYPEYVIFYAAMLANLWLAYRLFTRLGGTREIGAVAVLVWAVHGKFDYLYYNGGSLYDVFCFLFLSSALLIYLRARSEGRFLGVWGTIAFLACFICSLNSKEMAVTLPVIVFLYELLFHPPDLRAPDFRGFSSLVRWCGREGRMALIGAVCVLIYLPAKLGASGIGHDEAYVPRYRLERWLEDTGTFLGYIFYRDNSSSPLNVTPFSPLWIVLFFAILLAIALWLRSRAAFFGLLFFAVTALPVSFIPARLGFVLYMPLAGLALFAAVCLVRFKESLGKLAGDALQGDALQADAPLHGIPAWRPGWPVSSAALFLAAAILIGTIDYRHWPPAENPANSAYKITASEFARLYPQLPHGAKLLFVHTPLDTSWDMVFLLRNFYRDPDLFITELNGPPAQRIALNKLPRYDHIFDYVDGHYVELDNSDPLLSIKLHILKNPDPSYAFGESMTIGKPGAGQYIVKDVLVGDAKSDGYWTLDQPELQFRLASVQDHIFRERFFLPRETLQQTGPLIVDFYVNGHHLDQAHFAKGGEVLYERPVPEDWLKINDLTTVRMLVHNPYIAPRDHARLGFLLRSAGFSPIAVSL